MEKKLLFKESVGQKPGLTNPKTLGILLIVFLSVKLVLGLWAPADRVSLASDLSADNILQAVNTQRSLRNLVTLNTNGKLSYAAQSKADDMQARHYFAHVDPDGRYIWDKIVAAGYTPYLQLGENLAIEFYDTDSLVSAWMNSPTHRANLLNDGFRDQGMGLTFGDTSLNQYHSAIANTFGTLAPAPKPKAPVVTAKPASAPRPVTKTAKPKTLGSQQTASSTSPQIPSPILAETTPTSLPQPIEPRDILALNQNPNSNFLVPSNQVATTATTSLPVLTPIAPAGAIIGTQNNYALANYQLNRYLILFAGFILLMLMLSDIRKNVETKFRHLDKKTNNLAVLILALGAIAFLYWF